MNDLHTTNSNPGDSKPAKVILIGDSSVGKTSVVLQLYRSQFDPSSEPTIGAAYVTKTISASNCDILMHIWDTAGQERFKSVIPMYIRGCAAIVMICATDSLDSVKALDKWLRMIQESVADYENIIYVVLNKDDLKCEYDEDIPRRWAIDHNFKFFKTSAKNNEKIIGLFTVIAEDIANSQKYITVVSPRADLTCDNKKESQQCC